MVEKGCRSPKLVLRKAPASWTAERHQVDPSVDERGMNYLAVGEITIITSLQVVDWFIARK